MTDLMIHSRGSDHAVRYGDAVTKQHESFSQGRSWSSDGITVGISPPCGFWELHFKADTDIIVLPKAGYGGRRAINSDKAAEYENAPNDMYWLPTGTDLYSIGQSAKEVVYINFDRSVRMAFLETVPEAPKLDDSITPIKNVLRHQIFTLLLMNFVSTKGEFGGRLQAESLINLLLLEICMFNGMRSKSDVANPLSKPVLARVNAFIDDNIDADLSLAALADVAGISKFHFSRMFMAATDLSPHKYIMQRRIVRVQESLANTNECLSQIALDKGFSSQSHMTSAFKRLLGVTPNNYRRSLK
ncbi:AraC family transcriptional regulator [uncultured Tateyamaria sp.]|uniref:helix-turn-helix domain-containing protein n=1 Tax=uncultured Tateyamaria sp. TaxID=455651 RepID=UPI002612C700|nr:AraC family transcriptional regulator [uncultured Tateyamaria sp.]